MNATEEIERISRLVRPFNNTESLSLRDAWIYRAACSITRVIGSLDVTDPIIIRVGEACAAAPVGSTCVWHEFARITERPCNCARCTTIKAPK